MKIYKQIEVAELPYTHEEIAKKWNEYLTDSNGNMRRISDSDVTCMLSEIGLLVEGQ